MLKLGVIFAVILLAAILAQEVVKRVLGSSGHPFGNRYVVRYYYDGDVYTVYRDSNYWMTFRIRGWIQQSLFLEGIYCLAVVGIEAGIRFSERRNERRNGFEVIVSQRKPGDIT